MSIAPFSTDPVELHRFRGSEFVLRVGHNVIRLGTPAIADLLALLTLDEYAEGNRGGQVVHGNPAYRANPDAPDAAVLVANLGAYDKGNRSLPAHQRARGHQPDTDADLPASPDYQWAPLNLTLAVTAYGDTYVATLTRRDALRLIHAATRGMSDAE